MDATQDGALTIRMTVEKRSRDPAMAGSPDRRGPLRPWLLGLLLAAAAVTAQPLDATDRALADARRQMDSLRERMATAPTLDALSALRREAGDLQSRSAAVAAELAPEVANVEARLTELGAVPAAGKSDETAVLTAQRDSLAQQRARLDAQLRLARLLAIEAEQAAEQVATLRRARFEARLEERTPSILAPSFWSELRESWLHDVPRLRALARDLAATAGATAGWVWLFVIAGIAAPLALLPRVLDLLMRIATTRVPPGRIRRSLLALGTVLATSAAVLLATHAPYWGFVAGRPVPPAVASLLLGLAASISFGAFVAVLGRALMSPSRPSWRLPSMPDLLASRLRHDPLWLGVVIAIGWTLERLAALVNAGLGTAVAINCVFSLAIGALLVRTMQRSERVRRELLASPQPPPRPLWLLAAVIVSWGVLLASVVCLLLGYVALGSLLVKQVAWVLIVGHSAYLLAVFIDDACTAWLGVATEAGDEPAKVPPAFRLQVAVLLSAACRVVIVVVALALMIGPLGQGPTELLQRTDRLRDGIAIGEMRLLPGAVLQALLVLAIGIAAVRAGKHWLLERYLPTTTLDAGMRSSTATLLGYVGIVFAVALALSALGLGLERVAWVASALSVGIGFGLQAVVQNFVSGLILLTERPVKVGDWVALGGVEGDIRRINVRATEIQMGDRSTVIVPNSEFITKVVRNMTHANPLGLVQIKLPMPLDTDPEQVRSLMLAALDEHPDVAANPAPSVQLDGIDGGNLVFAATGSVGSPRQASGVKSALLFDILARLKAAGLPLGHAPAMVLREAPGTPAAATGSSP